jgi:hypothetical protein
MRCARITMMPQKKKNVNRVDYILSAACAKCHSAAQFFLNAIAHFVLHRRSLRSAGEPL